jgi:hypothetical protein
MCGPETIKKTDHAKEPCPGTLQATEPKRIALFVPTGVRHIVPPSFANSLGYELSCRDSQQCQ